MTNNNGITKHATITVLKENVENAGLIVWWTLQGPVHLSKLNKAAAQEEEFNSDLLPNPVTPSVALHRAMDGILSAGYKYRLTDDKTGWAIYTETKIEKDKKKGWEQLADCVVTLDENNKPTFDPPDFDKVVQLKILADMALAVKTFLAVDISSWLVSIAKLYMATSVRDHGAIYFVPANNVKQWDCVARVIKAASEDRYRVTGLVAMHGTDVVEDIISGLANEVELTRSRIIKIIEKGNVGVDGLRSRSIELSDLQDKMEFYENLLDRKLEDIRVGLVTVMADVSRSIMAIEAAEAKK